MVPVSVMIQRDYLIIGGGIGGASACEGVRRHDKRGLRDADRRRSVSTLQTLDPFEGVFCARRIHSPRNCSNPMNAWYETHKIETRFGTVVTQLNIDRRLAVLANGESIEFNKACLAMGSRPVRPPVAGISLGNVIYLRTIRDALALREMASLEKSLMVVGGGLLACEAAASLRMMKLKVGLMHRNSYLLNRYVDPETGAWFTDYFAKHGVAMSMGESLNGFEGKTVLRNIQTKSGNRFPVGLAVVACGAEPNLDLVRNTPLSGPHGSPVTEYLETEEKGNLCGRRPGILSGRNHGRRAPSDALGERAKQGLIAGANMTGKKRIRYEQVPYFWTEMFDLRMDFVGDFSVLPTRVDLQGTYAKKKFIARYYQGDKLRAILLCQQPPREVETAKTQLRQAQGK